MKIIRQSQKKYLAIGIITARILDIRMYNY